jgi:hypothetical protein
MSRGTVLLGVGLTLAGLLGPAGVVRSDPPNEETVTLEISGIT